MDKERPSDVDGLFWCDYNPSTIVPMVPLPDNGVPDKPACWGEFTGEALEKTWVVFWGYSLNLRFENGI